jgi:two-component system, NarL family, nitrate/nitrite response regulator NarL
MYNNILVIDDHPVMARALADMIRDVTPTAQFRTAGTLTEALHQIDNACPDLILADLSLPDAHGVDVVDRLRELAPTCIIAVCSAILDREVALQCLDRGAMAYLSKTDDTPELTRAIRSVMQGKCYLALEALTPSVRHITPAALKQGSACTQGLSPRQVEVLQCLLRGHSNQTVANTLSISLATAKVHVQAILRHYEVPNRVQLLIRLAELQAGV